MLTTCTKIPGSHASPSLPKRVNPELGKPPNSQFVFPHCFSDSFPFSLRTHHTPTLKTGNIHLHKWLLGVTRWKPQRWHPDVLLSLCRQRHAILQRSGHGFEASQVVPGSCKHPPGKPGTHFRAAGTTCVRALTDGSGATRPLQPQGP